MNSHVPIIDRRTFDQIQRIMELKAPRGEITRYLMEEGHDIRVPYRGYLDTLEEGYRRFGFNPYQLELAMKEAEEAER